MPMGRPEAEIALSEAERSQLISMPHPRSILTALDMRARIVLAAAAGEPNIRIAQRLGTTELVSKFNEFAARYNRNCTSFARTATAVCERIGGTEHYLPL